MADNVTQKDINDVAAAYGITLPKAQPDDPAPVDDPNAHTLSDIAEVAKLYGVDPTIHKTGKEKDKGAPVKITVRPRFRNAADSTSQLVEGMPVVGPAFDKGTAALTAVLDPLLAREPVAPTFKARYSNNLSDITQANKDYAEDNPVKSTAANLLGGTMLMGPLASTRLGGMLLGTRGPTMGTQVITGATGGGAIGATDAAMRGDNPISGAEIGAGGGALAPMIGGGVRGLVRGALENFMPRPGVLNTMPSITVKKLMGAVEGETPASIAAARTRMGPHGFVGDLNKGLSDITEGIVHTPGPDGGVRAAYQARADAQRSRVTAALDQHVSPATNIVDLKNQITEERAKTADPLYEAWRNTVVPFTDELKALVPRLDKAGAFNLAEESAGVRGIPMDREYFTASVKDGSKKAKAPTTETWDFVKRGLDRAIDRAYTSGDKTHARDLIQLKGDLINEIEKTDAGKIWKQARAAFAEKSALLDQIQAGRDTFLGSRSGLSADELAEELRGLSGPERMARIIGARHAAEEVMGATVNGDTTLRNKLLAPNNVKKMQLLLGKKNADQLIDKMEQEYFLGTQYKDIVGGSPTGGRAENIRALEPPPHEARHFNVAEPGSYVPRFVRENVDLGNVFPYIGRAAQAERYAAARHHLEPIMQMPQADPRFSPLLSVLEREAARRSQIGARTAGVGSGVAALVSGPTTTTARRRYFPAQ